MRKRADKSLIFAIAAGAGVAVTVAFAIREAPEARKKLEAAKMNNFGNELSFFEKTKTAFPIYIPMIASGVATLSCIFMSYGVGKRAYLGIAGAYSTLVGAYKQYQKRAKELFGEDGHVEVLKGIAKDALCDNAPPPSDDSEVLTFYDEMSNRYFQATMLDVRNAEYLLNRLFVIRGYATLNEFYELLNQEKVKGGDKIGWSIDAGCEFYGYVFVDFEHELVTMDDGLECYILSAPFPPTTDYFLE